MAGRTLIEVGYSVDGTSDLANEPTVAPGAAPAPAGTLAFVIATGTVWLWLPSPATPPVGSTSTTGVGGNWVYRSGIASSTVQRIVHEIYKLPDAIATAYSGALAKATTQGATAVSAQPNCPRVAQVTTSGAGFTTTTAVVVTVTGVKEDGTTDSDIITILAAGGAQTIQGVKAFMKFTGYTWTMPASWSAGTFEVQAGTKLGLPHAVADGSLVVLKEVGYTDATPTPANATVGTVDTTNFTYVPTTELSDGLSDVEVWYSVTATT